MAALSDKLGFGPARADVPDGAVAFTAHADGAAGDLATMLAQVYPLDALAQDYHRVPGACPDHRRPARNGPADSPASAADTDPCLADDRPARAAPAGASAAERASGTGGTGGFRARIPDLCPLAEQHAQVILTMTAPQAATVTLCWQHGVRP